MKFLFTGNLYSSIFQQTTILIVCFVFLIILEGASVVRFLIPHPPLDVSAEDRLRFKNKTTKSLCGRLFLFYVKPKYYLLSPPVHPFRSIVFHACLINEEVEEKDGEGESSPTYYDDNFTVKFHTCTFMYVYMYVYTHVCVQCTSTQNVFMLGTANFVYISLISCE